MIHRLEPSPGVLYVVGTPIGHLGDLSPRAKELLRNVSVIACEDTRHSGKLIKPLKSNGKLISFHKHNIQSKLPKLLALLEQKKSIAIISDAGLPGISDPGEDLVKAARDEGHEVICIPGPCAATTALVSSGLPSGRFCFEGFLPTKEKERKEYLKNLAKEERTIIIYEAPHRLIKLLKELKKSCGGDRPLQVARELTKRHEQQIGSTIDAALEHFLKIKPLGECTLVLGGATAIDAEFKDEDYLLAEIKLLIEKGSSASDAASKIAEISGMPKKSLYNLFHRSIKK